MCPAQVQLDHGDIWPRDQWFRAGATQSFSCHEGFTLSGSAQRNCTISGTWTGKTPVCDNHGEGRQQNEPIKKYIQQYEYEPRFPKVHIQCNKEVKCVKFFSVFLGKTNLYTVIPFHKHVFTCSWRLQGPRDSTGGPEVSRPVPRWREGDLFVSNWSGSARLGWKGLPGEQGVEWVATTVPRCRTGHLHSF